MDDEPSEAATADGGSNGHRRGGEGGGHTVKLPLQIARSGSAAAPPVKNEDQDEAVILIAPRGDVVLDVLFVASNETLRPSRKAAAGAAAARRGRVTTTSALPTHGPLQSALRRAYRVDAVALQKRSRYFANLLGDTRFEEARAVEAARAAMVRDNVRPAEADVSRLPRVHIEDDDERSRAAGRELLFTELLRILHSDGSSSSSSNEPTKEARENLGAVDESQVRREPPKPAGSKAAKPGKATPGKTRLGKAPALKTSASTKARGQPESSPLAVFPSLPGSRWSAKTPPTLLELATLAMQADRFDCTDAVAAFVRTLRLRFPQALVRPGRDGGGSGGSGGGEVVRGKRGHALPHLFNEEAIRQKIFVSWRFDQPLRFHASTRELIVYGSRRWVGDDNDNDGNDADGILPAWWDLPDGLESELQFRRACILNCIASVTRHFLALYTARNRRQCTMGYGSSAACDSFQLGETVKFLYQKDLLFLHDFSGRTVATAAGRRTGAAVAPADYAAVDIYHVLATLKQCPTYQLDKDHVHCGMRARILPILEYIRAMLSAGAVAVHRHEWATPRHGQASWLAAAEAAGYFEDDGDDDGYNDNDNDNDNDNENGDNSWDNRVPHFGKYRPALQAEQQQEWCGVFRFDRSMASDQRLRFEGNLTADRMARQLFTARAWNWTPDGW
ncbi:hypothetical protein SPI_00996 [Niveomyces insectorum RCEF 264]|uniref:Uncharacterized protein n=1 Tax=Niveomyces insectorum RCEF 264 TaxID=1081102 RepID=A0A168AIM1_9HYPO|nr:hypothetical protein SPI_00996 [Niveomyces insectorum RCEF 264]